MAEQAEVGEIRRMGSDLVEVVQVLPYGQVYVMGQKRQGKVPLAHLGPPLSDEELAAMGIELELAPLDDEDMDDEGGEGDQGGEPAEPDEDDDAEVDPDLDLPHPPMPPAAAPQQPAAGNITVTEPQARPQTGALSNPTSSNAAPVANAGAGQPNTRTPGPARTTVTAPATRPEDSGHGTSVQPAQPRPDDT